MSAVPVSHLIEVNTTFGLLVGSLELYSECRSYANALVLVYTKKGSILDPKQAVATWTAFYQSNPHQNTILLVQLLMGHSMTLKKTDLVVLNDVSAKLKKAGKLNLSQKYLNNVIHFIDRYGRIKINNMGNLHKSYYGFDCFNINQMF